MNSFTLTAVGNLAKNPEAAAKGETARTRFCLIGTDYAGKDDVGGSREVVTSLWFVAFGALAESLVRNARKGDQLIIEARVRSNNWVDKQGDKQYDHDFIVEGYRFGAPGKIKREEFGARRIEGPDEVASPTDDFDTEVPYFDESDIPLVGPGSPVIATKQPHHTYVAEDPVQHALDIDLGGKADADGETSDISDQALPAAKAPTGKSPVKKKTPNSRARRS
jgi:single-strand DNA-binding protein